VILLDTFTCERLGGRSEGAVPQLLSFATSASTNSPPSKKKPCVIRFFVDVSLFKVALWTGERTWRGGEGSDEECVEEKRRRAGLID
jgi:hypothetical protein